MTDAVFWLTLTCIGQFIALCMFARSHRRMDDKIESLEHDLILEKHRDEITEMGTPSKRTLENWIKDD